MNNKYLKLITFFILLSLGVNGQQSISLSFSSSSNLDSVRIDNLNNASYKVLKGSYSVVLNLETPNFIENIYMINEPLVYPNPFNEQVNLEFLSPNMSDVNFAVYDLSGKVVAQLNKIIEQGSHRFTFKPSKPGVYLVKVSDKLSVYNAKLICAETNSGIPSIEYEGLISTQIIKQSKAKSITTKILSDLTVNNGDMLKFTGYSSSKINSLYDLAYAPKSYSFIFGNPFYNFRNYYVQPSKPCFVDIMFSVTDANNKGIDYLTNSDFTVTEDNATVSPTETFRFVRKMQQIPFKLKTVLLLDVSTSIAADLETIKSAAIKFVKAISDKQEVAIYTFSDNPVLVQKFTNDKTKILNSISNITTGFPSTNLYGSVVTALSQWTDNYTINALTQGCLILFTDGSDTQASSTLSSVINARGDKKVYVIGLGNEITPTVLNQMANPGPYYSIQKASELEAVFASIQSDIIQYSNSFYWLNYMSPKRTNTHTLKVSSTNNTNTSTTSYLTGSFSAVGFSSVLSGAYVNIEDTRLYGLDTIRCFSSSAGYSFTYDANGLNQYSKDSLVLKPVTYWASKPPVYSWINNKTNISLLKASTYSAITLLPLSIGTDTTIITLKDVANAFTKNVVLIICPYYALVKCATPKNISTTSALLGGEVTNIGRTVVAERGICWNNSTSPTISNNKLAVGTGKGVFESNVSGLSKGIKYFVRAYATNAASTVYSNEFSFTTLANVPTLNTNTITNITQSTASCGVTVSSEEGAAVTARGVCWSTNQNPTISNNITKDGTGIGTFTSSINGLTAETTYYVRAYATNNIGTDYGTQVSFSTKLPTLTTSAVSTITATTAICGGNITDIGGATVTGKGVCWSTSPNPTIALSTKTYSGFGTGVYTSSISGLTIGTSYYVRSYATNSIGTIYGNEISFTTNLPTITTTDISSINATTSMGGGNVSDIGGSTLTARGICWSTTANPTVINTRTTDGTGLGAFISSITGLTIGTTYYVRAYATNNIGTVYGEQMSFSTTMPTVTTSSASNITSSTATCGGNVTPIVGTSVTTARGVCWSITTSPTIALSTKTADGNGSGIFNSSITGLTIGKIYYVRAYASNAIGTNYGAEISFSTILPTLTTSPISTITISSAISGGNITNTGGSQVISRGICWNTNTSPTITNNFILDTGSGIGSFMSKLTGLVTGIKYYVRSFATSAVGTAYGNELNFTTLSLPTITTSTLSAISSKSAMCSATISSDGGVPVTGRGICWSTTIDPTIANNKISSGTGSGTFTISLTGLTPGATYYVRAYATNSFGTVYNSGVNFTTPNTVLDIDGNLYSEVVVGTQVWMVENLKTSKYRDGSPILNITDNASWLLTTTGAWCNYDNDISNGIKYGHLYNWYTVNDSRNVAPLGWHVASDAEWTTLTTYLGGGAVAAKKLKEIGISSWDADGSATNGSGFTALGGGYRRTTDGSFSFLRYQGKWWNSTAYNSTDALFWALDSSSYSVIGLNTSKITGMSIRCVKD